MRTEASDSLPSTTAARSTTTTTAVQRECPRADVVDIGGCIEVDTTGAIYLGDDVYIPERPIASKPNNRRWERADFPAEWDVEIVNEAPEDGIDWIIRNVHATRVDDDTLEVVEPTTGDLVGMFLRDERLAFSTRRQPTTRSGSVALVGTRACPSHDRGVSDR